METSALVVLFAILVEAVVQVVKAGVPETVRVPAWLWPSVSAVIGVTMCVTAGVDALSSLGIEIKIAFIGQTITGLLVSRGASFVHDVWNMINNRVQVYLDFDELVELKGLDEGFTKR